MELIYAALLIHKAGNQITEESLKKVLEAAGAKADETKIKALVAALDGIDIDQAIKEAAVVATAPASGAGDDSKAAEEKKEEKKEEEKKDEAQAAAGLGALFG